MYSPRTWHANVVDLLRFVVVIYSVVPRLELSRLCFGNAFSFTILFKKKSFFEGLSPAPWGFYNYLYLPDLKAVFCRLMLPYIGLSVQVA